MIKIQLTKPNDRLPPKVVSRGPLVQWWCGTWLYPSVLHHAMLNRSLTMVLWR